MSIFSLEHVCSRFIYSLISSVHFTAEFMFVLNKFISIWKCWIQAISFFRWERSQAQLLPNNYSETVVYYYCIFRWLHAVAARRGHHSHCEQSGLSFVPPEQVTAWKDSKQKLSLECRNISWDLLKIMHLGSIINKIHIHNETWNIVCFLLFWFF